MVIDFDGQNVAKTHINSILKSGKKVVKSGKATKKVGKLFLACFYMFSLYNINFKNKCSHINLFWVVAVFYMGGCWSFSSNSSFKYISINLSIFTIIKWPSLDPMDKNKGYLNSLNNSINHVIYNEFKFIQFRLVLVYLP